MFVGGVHGTTQVVKISTKWYVDKTQRKAFADLSKKRFCSLTSRGTLLEREKEALPCHKACSLPEWRHYADAVIPLLPDILRVWQQRIFRRQSLKSYIAIDKTLDKQCRAITGRKREVLVAFGAANTCHTGFGYAPVPQKRLRHRLERIHGAQVSDLSSPRRAAPRSQGRQFGTEHDTDLSGARIARRATQCFHQSAGGVREVFLEISRSNLRSGAHLCYRHD